MKKIIYITFASTLFTMSLFGQNVGINLTGAIPNASSMLDVVSTNKGILIPRVSLSATTSTSPVLPAPGATENGLLVYNIATAGDVTPGFYYWDGVLLKWVRMLNGGTSSTGWLTTGNVGTVAGTNFLGTTDAQDLAIFTNNAEKMRVMSGGNVGIGTIAPLAKFQVNADGGDGIMIKASANDCGDLFFQDAAGVEKGRIYTDNGAGVSGMYLSGQTSGYNMYLASNGSVGIGTTTPTARLQVVNSDNSLNNILQIHPLNLTQGVGIGYNYIREIGSNANNDLSIDSKGAGNIFMQNAANSTGNVYVNFVAGMIANARLQVGGRISSYQAGAEASYHLYNGGAVQEWVIRQPPFPNDNLYIQSLNGGTYTNSITVSGVHDGTTGNVGIKVGAASINTAIPYALMVNGQPGANGFTAFTNYSDARLKRNIVNIGSSLDKIMQLRPVQFNYNEEYLNLYNDTASLARLQKGFIAQEVKEIFPEMVGSVKLKEGKEYYDLNLSNLQVYMVKAMQEQQQLINEQKQTIADQQMAINKVMAENKSLKANTEDTQARVLKLEAAVEKLSKPNLKVEAKK